MKTCGTKNEKKIWYKKRDMESHCWGKGIAGEIVIQYKEKEWPGDWVGNLISLRAWMERLSVALPSQWHYGCK